MCFAPQRRAIFHFSAKQLPPHPPLYQAYFSKIRNHESSKKHSDSRLSYSRVDPLSSDLTSLVCFSTVHIVGSWTSKLPSMREMHRKYVVSVDTCQWSTLRSSLATYNFTPFSLGDNQQGLLYFTRKTEKRCCMRLLAYHHFQPLGMMFETPGKG